MPDSDRADLVCLGLDCDMCKKLLKSLSQHFLHANSFEPGPEYIIRRRQVLLIELQACTDVSSDLRARTRLQMQTWMFML